MTSEAIPTDLISTKKAAELFGFKDSSAVRYYVTTNRVKGYKNRKGFMFISESEFRDVLRPDFQSVN
jgi:hypothetical protein